MPTTDSPRAGRGGEVKSLETTFRIIEGIEALDGAGVTEIAKTVGVAKSTVYDHLSTLEANNFLVREPDGTYRVGLRFLDHGGRARSRLDLYQTAPPEVRKLASETGELVNLVVEENGLGVYIDYAKGEDAVSLDTYLGKREHLHSTAFGKAMLAHMSPSQVDAVIERYGLPAETERTISSREALEDRLDTVSKNGFAVDNEERLERLCCVAAPIKSDDGTIVGAVSISGPTGRLDEDRLRNELADAVMRTANIIEINLTYSSQ